MAPASAYEPRTALTMRTIPRPTMAMGSRAMNAAALNDAAPGILRMSA